MLLAKHCCAPPNGTLYLATHLLGPLQAYDVISSKIKSSIAQWKTGTQCENEKDSKKASLFRKVAKHCSVFFLLHLSHSWNFILQIPLFPRKSIVLTKSRRTVMSLKQQMNSYNMFTCTCKKQHKRQKLIKQEKHCYKGKSTAYNCFRLHAPCIFFKLSQ